MISSQVEKAWTDKTKLLFVETPTNPVLRLTDHPRRAKLAHARGAMLAVDNTFMSPYFQNPLALGADVVVHSTTKYLNGHSDMVGGIVLSSDDELHEKLRFLQNAAGAVPGPWDCWLALRGVKTLRGAHAAARGERARHRGVVGRARMRCGRSTIPA